MHYRQSCGKGFKGDVDYLFQVHNYLLGSTFLMAWIVKWNWNDVKENEYKGKNSFFILLGVMIGDWGGACEGWEDGAWVLCVWRGQQGGLLHQGRRGRPSPLWWQTPDRGPTTKGNINKFVHGNWSKIPSLPTAEGKIHGILLKVNNHILTLVCVAVFIEDLHLPECHILICTCISLNQNRC